MLVRFFKSTQPIVIIAYFLFAMAMRIPAYFDCGFVSSDYPLYSLCFDHEIFQSWLNPLFTSLLIFVQGLLLNFIINSIKLLKQNSKLVGLSFVMINSLHPSFFVLNPIIIANTFVIAECAGTDCLHFRTR